MEYWYESGKTGMKVEDWVKMEDWDESGRHVESVRLV